jgi:RNA polymerase sigma-70 factor, ECF subfamily
MNVAYEEEVESRVVPLPGSNAYDAALFARFVAGEDEAFVELFHLYHRKIFTYCFRMVREAAAAEDLAQESFVRLVGQRLKPERLKNPGGFLVRVARNLSLDYLKSRRKLSSFDELLESDHPHNPGNEQSEREEIVQMELEKLPTIYREVLELNLFCGYKLEEIAAMLDKSPDAIWARASRARTQLRHAVAAALDALEKNNEGN